MTDPTRTEMPLVRLVPPPPTETALLSFGPRPTPLDNMDLEISMLKFLIKQMFESLQEDKNDKPLVYAQAPKLARMIDSLARAIVTVQKLNVAMPLQTQIRIELERIYRELSTPK